MSETFPEVVHGFGPHGSQLFLTHRRLLQSCGHASHLQQPREHMLMLSHCCMGWHVWHLAFWNWAMAPQHQSQGLFFRLTCASAYVIVRGRAAELPCHLSNYKIHEVVPQSSSCSYFGLKFCSSLPRASHWIPQAVCSAKSIFSCNELICKSLPYSVTASGDTSCIFSLRLGWEEGTREHTKHSEALSHVCAVPLLHPLSPHLPSLWFFLVAPLFQSCPLHY